eukprot:g21942.t1
MASSTSRRSRSTSSNSSNRSRQSSEAPSDKDDEKQGGKRRGSDKEEGKKSAKGQKWKDSLDKVVESVCAKLKRREIRGSGAVATQTLELLRTVISKGQYTSIAEMLDAVRRAGKKLQDARHTELAIGNMVRRVLFIIRREAAAVVSEVESGKTRQDSEENEAQTDEITKPGRPPMLGEADVGKSLVNLLETAPTSDVVKVRVERKRDVDKTKALIMEALTEVIDEIRHLQESIAEQAVEHIFANEIILTYGVSRVVTAFLKEAAKFRRFEVFVAESSPSYSGQQAAASLAYETMQKEMKEIGIPTTIITDSAVFAMMSVVNKVIIGTHAVMANGGIVAHTGGANICLAASYHAVPVVVLSGLHKLSPLYAFNQDTFNQQNPPSQILGFEENYIEKVDVCNPAFDYIQPELISLFITNFGYGGHAPSYIYRLLAEFYNAEDYTL